MSRYSNKKFIKEKKKEKHHDGRMVRRYLIDLPYPVEYDQDELTILTKLGDRLDNLANTYYNDPTKWYIIAAANPHVYEGSLFIRSNEYIRIPIDENYNEKENEFNDR